MVLVVVTLMFLVVVALRVLFLLIVLLVVLLVVLEAVCGLNFTHRCLFIYTPSQLAQLHIFGGSDLAVGLLATGADGGEEI